MIEHKDPTFIVLGQSITLISDECSHGLNTVADMGDFVHYMGNEYPTISTAIFAYQEVHDRLLSSEEIHQVMIQNGLIEGDKNASQEKSCEITDEDIIEEIPSQEVSKKDFKSN